MKLLIEHWRKFIKEDIGYFGSKFVEFKQEVDKGVHPLVAAQKHLEYIGKGSTRKVFGFQDNDSHLLKVINVDLYDGEEVYDPDFKNPLTGFDRKHKIVSNENEADLMMQQKYPNVFPRTYEVADDYSWILAERVEPISSERLADELGIPQDLTRRENRDTYLELIKMVMIMVRSSLNEMMDTVEITPRVMKSPEEAEAAGKEEMYNIRRLYEMAGKIAEDKHLKNLFRAVQELRIPPRELTAKNLGISKFGGEHLVILDASLWEYEEEASAPEPPPKKIEPPPPAEDTYVTESKVLKIKFLKQ